MAKDSLSEKFGGGDFADNQHFTAINTHKIMKKLILAAIIALTAAACTKEDTTVTNNSNITAVEFNISLADRASRAFAKAESVDCLHYNIFLAGEESAILSGSEQIDTDGEFHFSLNLAKGVEYDIIFWAQDASCTAYTLTGKSVTIDYTAISANDDAADAFFGSASSFNPSEDSSTFTLKRPFAQLNAATKDYQAIADLGAVSMTSTVSLKAHNKFNIATGDVFGDKVDVAFTATAIPAETFHISGYKYLLMNYILAPKAASTLTNTTFTFIGKRADNSTINIPSQTYTSIPLQQNCRTNILGSLLTSPTQFNVELSLGFGANEHDHDIVPANQFWYTTATGDPLPFNLFNIFDKGFVSQSYNAEDGRWEATFNGAITEVYGISDFNISNEEILLRSNITSIQLPEGVQTIGLGAFALTSITEFTVPQSVTSLGYGAVAGCRYLKAVYGKYASADNRYLVDDGVLNSPALADVTTSEYTLPTDVVAIGPLCFAMLGSQFSKLIIPDNIQYILPLSFYGNPSIKEVVIGSGVTFLEGASFSGASALESVTISGSLSYSGSYVALLGDFMRAFDSCPALREFNSPQASSDKRCLVIGGKLVEIALAGVGNEYSIPSGITTLNEEVFRNVALDKLIIGNNVETISSNALYRSEIKEVVIGDSVQSIGKSCFSECSYLTKVTIEGSTTIDEYAFAECGRLEQLHITSLKDWCETERKNEYSNPLVYIKSENANCGLYLNDTKIEGTLTIPDGTTTIKDFAFLNLTTITGVEVPASVQSLGDGVFKGCTNISSFSGPNASADGSYLKIGSTLAAFAPASTVTTFAIPAGTTTIGNYALYDAKKLTSITIPDSVTTIGDYSFSGCKLIQTIVIPDSVVSIGANAFDRCYKLNKITLGRGLRSIGEYAFTNCSINWIDANESTGYVEDITVYCRRPVPPTVQQTINTATNEYFYSKIFDTNDTYIYVPASADDSIINAYKNAGGWNLYSNFIED